MTKRKRAAGRETADTNALAFTQDEYGPSSTTEHIKKRKLKKSGLVVTFDPAAHKEYLTGFHKRKQERRQQAQKQIAEKEKKQRLEDRAEKRAKLREELDLARYETASEDEEGNASLDEDEKTVKTYQGPAAVTTVITSSVHLYSDELKSIQYREAEPTEAAVANDSKGTAGGVDSLEDTGIKDRSRKRGQAIKDTKRSGALIKGTSKRKGFVLQSVKKKKKGRKP